MLFLSFTILLFQLPPFLRQLISMSSAELILKLVIHVLHFSIVQVVPFFLFLSPEQAFVVLLLLFSSEWLVTLSRFLPTLFEQQVLDLFSIFVLKLCA
jgi:hypothetical protein